MNNTIKVYLSTLRAIADNTLDEHLCNERMSKQFLSEIFECAKKQGLFSFLVKHLESHGIASGEAICQANKEFLQNEGINEVRLSSLETLFRALTDKHIPYAVLKGAYLAKTAYGAYGYRKSNDIDILILKNDITKVKKLCAANDFVEGKFCKRDSQIVPYSRMQTLAFPAHTHQIATQVKVVKQGEQIIDITLDANFSLAWKECPQQIDVISFLRSTRLISVDIGKRKMMYPVLGIEQYLLQLIMHAYKESNGIIYISYIGNLSLRAMYDILLYKNAVKGQLNIQYFVRLVRHDNLDDYVYYIAYNIMYLFGTDAFFEDVIHQLFPAQNIVDCYGLEVGKRYYWDDIDIYSRYFAEDLWEKMKKKLPLKELEQLEIKRKEFY